MFPLSVNWIKNVIWLELPSSTELFLLQVVLCKGQDDANTCNMYSSVVSRRYFYFSNGSMGLGTGDFNCLFSRNYLEFTAFSVDVVRELHNKLHNLGYFWSLYPHPSYTGLEVTTPIQTGRHLSMDTRLSFPENDLFHMM